MIIKFLGRIFLLFRRVKNKVISLCQLSSIPHGKNCEIRGASSQFTGNISFGDNVIIEDDVWIGAGTIILKGVTIAKGSIIGAGSVVTKDIPSGVLAVGNPCRVIREITQEDSIEFKKDLW